MEHSLNRMDDAVNFIGTISWQMGWYVDFADMLKTLIQKVTVENQVSYTHYTFLCWRMTLSKLPLCHVSCQKPVQAPVPLTKFWSNVKFDSDMFVYISFLISLIIMKFCTCQDSYAVLGCAKFCYDQIILLRIVLIMFFHKILEVDSNISTEMGTRETPPSLSAHCVGV